MLSTTFIDERGSLEAGKLAVLSDDYLTMDVEDIVDLESVLTMVAGDVVYSPRAYARLEQRNSSWRESSGCHDASGCRQSGDAGASHQDIALVGHGTSHYSASSLQKSRNIGINYRSSDHPI